MKYYLKRIVLLCLSIIPIFAIGNEALENKVKISLLTCSPGQELYSLFGHSAIRVYAPSQNIDIVYNYGTFDFDTPGFGVKFIRGKLPYKLAVGKYESFMREYDYFQRDVEEQVLNIDSTQTAEIISFLQNNAKSENALYAYDFLFDNCSTRIRDIILPYSDYTKESLDGLSFREMLIPYINNHAWTAFGIHLILSGVTDKNADFYTQMFLPDYLRDNLALVKTEDGNLLKKTSSLLSFVQQNKSTDWWIHPNTIFALLLLAVILLYYFNKKKAFNILKKTVYFITGCGGLLFLFMWFFTDHQATYANWNLLWLSPIYLFILNNKIIYNTLIIKTLIILNIISVINIFFNFLPQYFDFSFVLPLFLLLFLLISEYLGNQKSESKIQKA